MTEKEKEYVCDTLCRFPYLYDDQEQLDIFCAKCMLNKSRTERRKEYMQDYYKKKIKPARMKNKLNKIYGIQAQVALEKKEGDDE